MLGAAAEAAWLQGDLVNAEELALRGIAEGTPNPRCSHALAAVSMFRGQPDRAIDLWETAAELEPLYRPNAGLAAIYAGRLELAVELNRQSAAWATDHGVAQRPCLGPLRGRRDGPGRRPRRVRRRHRPRPTIRGDLHRGRRDGRRWRPGWRQRGAHDRALDTYDEVVRYWQRTGSWTQQWTTLRNVAVLLDERGDSESAAVILASAAGAAEAAAVLDGSTDWPVEAAPLHGPRWWPGRWPPSTPNATSADGCTRRASAV